MAEQAAAEAVKAVQPLGDGAWFLRDLVTYMLTRVS
jgi:geranylgeranyl diphosphate synthase type II